MKILITGVAGFIGYHLAKSLLEVDTGEHFVYGLDNFNNYYDPKLKKERMQQLHKHWDFRILNFDIGDKDQFKLQRLHRYKFDMVINLAAMAGTIGSFKNPQEYINSNITGFTNVLDFAVENGVKHVLYASSSSVYGEIPNSKINVVSSHGNYEVITSVVNEKDNTDRPLSFYGATKKANELIAHSYSHFYNLPITGMRFFTVYGPWGRPDMALYKFIKAISEGNPIDVYNYGNSFRDFTYIDDIIAMISKIIYSSPPKVNSYWEALNDFHYKHRVYNLGSSNKINLMNFINIISTQLGKKPKLNFLDLPLGDVPYSEADMSLFNNTFGTIPITPLEDGIQKCIEWYNYYSKIINHIDL